MSDNNSEVVSDIAIAPVDPVAAYKARKPYKSRSKTIEVGSVVRLKSGGPKMTVGKIEAGLDIAVRVAWFADDSKCLDGQFRLSSLELAE